MAPPRQRTTAIVDDSRSEASSGTREYKNPPKSRRPVAAKDKTSVTSAPVDQIVDDQPRLPWSDLPLEILHSYRHVHKLPTPSAFASDYSRTILSQGIGLRSPTSLAARRAQSSSSHPHNNTHFHAHNHSGHRGRNGESGDSLRRIVGQDRVSKDQFALVVRRHFNSAGLSEQETIARFLYTVREERRGRQFRLRFQP
ncbi:hypothetical protein PENANT_c040G07107 [Penicillium antarcticum]|uniref:Histone deacetylase complex subunit SAP30 Sin3 binding domain-containing protein n=1 Tax=Penicillium antarcticum TaxID=416450 RepID=A0A1V6PSP4_9EURO|nr:uncharacterized protein N7508_000200 [Penicillium antarcticum]KAJ5319917.1 hypothetical protein N7508_000200 [Penicillium antarcticum]OQD80059.1 hypothetical protein PENANT_c040G07107 [Penicillium antarcticum]